MMLYEERYVFTLQILFIVYMVLISLLLINMLIAMMGNTYQTVAGVEREYLRQVGHRFGKKILERS